MNPTKQSPRDGLEPCPFCGGEAQRHTIGPEEPNNAGGDVIVCTRCQASSHVEFGRKENLVSHWNTRTSHPNAAEPVDSGFGNGAAERAEMAWANLPTVRKWTSLSTAEKAIVCHTLARLSSPAPQDDARADVRGPVEALEWIDLHKDDQDMNHVNFRIGAGSRARAALNPTGEA